MKSEYPNCPVIPVRIFGGEVLCMIDTGATITSISERLADLIEKSGLKKSWEINEQVKAFGNTEVTMKRKIQCHIQFGNGPHSYEPVFVHNDTPFDVAIGHDVCKALGLDIKYSNRTLEQDELATPWLTNMQAYRSIQEIDERFSSQDFRLSHPLYHPV